MGEIRKLSPGGDNVLRYVRYIDSESADYFNFGDGAGYKLMTGEGRSTVFSDISVDSTGLIFALDQTYGKVFIYDQNCNSLSIFGTGLGQGTQEGSFVLPVAMVNHGDDVLVLDKNKNSLTVFKPTPIMAQIRGGHGPRPEGRISAGAAALGRHPVPGPELPGGVQWRRESPV